MEIFFLVHPSVSGTVRLRFPVNMPSCGMGYRPVHSHICWHQCDFMFLLCYGMEKEWKVIALDGPHHVQKAHSQLNTLSRIQASSFIRYMIIQMQAFWLLRLAEAPLPLQLQQTALVSCCTLVALTQHFWMFVLGSGSQACR